VYITDTLDEDLDDSTLTIENNGSYDPETRTITWFIGEITSKQKGPVYFSVNVSQNAPDKSEIPFRKWKKVLFRWESLYYFVTAKR